jgi:hypothetical protein
LNFSARNLVGSATLSFTELVHSIETNHVIEEEKKYPFSFFLAPTRTSVLIPEPDSKKSPPGLS